MSPRRHSDDDAHGSGLADALARWDTAQNWMRAQQDAQADGGDGAVGASDAAGPMPGAPIEPVPPAAVIGRTPFDPPEPRAPAPADRSAVAPEVPAGARPSVVEVPPGEFAPPVIGANGVGQPPAWQQPDQDQPAWMSYNPAPERWRRRPGLENIGSDRPATPAPRPLEPQWRATGGAAQLPPPPPVPESWDALLSTDRLRFARENHAMSTPDTGGEAGPPRDPQPPAGLPWESPVPADQQQASGAAQPGPQPGPQPAAVPPPRPAAAPAQSDVGQQPPPVEEPTQLMQPPPTQPPPWASPAWPGGQEHGGGGQQHGGGGPEHGGGGQEHGGGGQEHGGGGQQHGGGGQQHGEQPLAAGPPPLGPGTGVEPAAQPTGPPPASSSLPPQAPAQHAGQQPPPPAPTGPRTGPQPAVGPGTGQQPALGPATRPQPVAAPQPPSPPDGYGPAVGAGEQPGSFPPPPGGWPGLPGPTPPGQVTHPTQGGAVSAPPPLPAPPSAPPSGAPVLWNDQAPSVGARAAYEPRWSPAPPVVDTPVWAPPGERGAPTVEDLTAQSLIRQRKRPPRTGWRKAVYTLSGHAVNPGEAPADIRQRELMARATVPVRGCYRIAVISLKGGVGKTTMTVCLGATLAALRGDRVIAVDANPDRGTLSGKIPLETVATVRNLLNDAPQIQRYSDVRRYTSQSADRLEVLASESDPAVSIAFSAEDYRVVAGILERFYNVVLTDCGTGLLHSAMGGVLALANQLVVVSSGSVDGARSASATLDWLEAHGYRALVAGSVAVINSVRPKSGGVDLDRLQEHFAARCRAVVRVPYDPHLEEGAEVDLSELREETRGALLELAAHVADAFPREAGILAPPPQQRAPGPPPPPPLP